MMIQYLIVCPLIFLAGLVDSIAGGGGLISLPAYLIAGVPPHVALGTNKTSSAMGTAVSTFRLAKHGYLKGKAVLALIASVSALCGSALGARLALMVPDSVTRNLMIVVLPVTAWYVLRNKNIEGNGQEEKPEGGKLKVIVAASAFFIGGYDGFYGPGTGTFMLLILTGAAGLETRSASALTKVTNLSSNLAALATFIVTGNVYYPLGLTAGLCSIAGNYLGAGLVVHDGQKIVRPVVLLVLSILFIKILSGH